MRGSRYQKKCWHNTDLLSNCFKAENASYRLGFKASLCSLSLASQIVTSTPLQNLCFKFYANQDEILCQRNMLKFYRSITLMILG